MSTQPPQTKTVSATEAQNNFGELSKWVAKENRIVYIQNNRTSEKLGLVSEKYVKEAEQLKDKERRLQALEKLEQLRKEISANLTDEECKVISEEVDEAFREVIDEKIAKGEIKYIQ